MLKKSHNPDEEAAEVIEEVGEEGTEEGAQEAAEDAEDVDIDEEPNEGEEGIEEDELLDTQNTIPADTHPSPHHHHQNITLDDDIAHKEHIRLNDSYTRDRFNSVSKLVADIPFQKKQEEESFRYNFLTHAKKATKMGLGKE